MSQNHHTCAIGAKPLKPGTAFPLATVRPTVFAEIDHLLMQQWERLVGI